MLLNKIKPIIYTLISRPLYVFKRHILFDILKGNFTKPRHFIKSILKHKLLGHPYLAMIETCNYCNLQCPTCPTPHHKIQREKKMMRFEDYKKIIDNIKNSVHVILLYFSNEPLLHPQLPEMIEYAHKNNLYTMLSTNAVLLNNETAKNLYDSNLDEILLCLDSLKKDSYEAFRKGAVFETVLENIKNFCKMKQDLKRRKPYIELQFILNKLNQDEVGGIRKFAKGLRVGRLHIKSFALSEYAYTKEEIKSLAEKFFPTQKGYQGKIRYRKEGHALKIKKQSRFCKLVDSDVVVLADGRVSMCCYDIRGQYTYGSVLDHKLSDLWHDAEARLKRNSAKNRRYPLCKICAN